MRHVDVCVSGSRRPNSAGDLNTGSRNRRVKPSGLPIRRLLFPFILVCFCTMIIIPEKMNAQDIDRLKNMTPAQRADILKTLPPEQQQAVKEMLTKEGAASLESPAHEKEPQRFEGLSVEPRSAPEDQGPDFEVVGMSAFKPARDRILAVEAAIRQGRVPPVETKDALSGYVGPLDMISSHVATGTPERYFLSPGDEITVIYWGNNLQLTTVYVRLDEKGEVRVPEIGRIVARGMTLEQFEKAAGEQYARLHNPTDFHLIATLDRLRSIRVTISGRAFRPGSYAVSAVTTLFNALHACGGPDEDGTLRKVRLLRGKTVTEVDFYDYLLKGNTRQDHPLQGGDIVHVGFSGKRIHLRGEVYRPGIYEVKENETLSDLIQLAGGVKPTGLTDPVFVETVAPGREKMTRDIDLDDKEAVAGLPLTDGDIVTVRSLFPSVRNVVTVAGHVKNPGRFEFKPGMRLWALVQSANPLSDACFDKAVLTRYHFEDGRYSRIELNLEALLAGESAENILLQDWDSLRIFSKYETVFTPEREVFVRGAVQRPGPYIRSEGMRIRDLLFDAGGLLPGYYETATLARARSEKETEIVAIDLAALLQGDESDNLVLHDQDVLNVKKRTDFYDSPEWITITGEVRYPGPYALKDRNVRLSAVIEMAGGFTPEAYPRGLVLKRQKAFLVQNEQEDLLLRTNRSAIEEMKIQYYQAEMKNHLALSAITEEAGEDKAAAPRLPVITGSVISEGEIEKAMAAGLVPSIAEGAGKTAEKTVESLERSPTVGAVLREFSEGEMTYGEMERISVDIDDITAGRKEDIVVKPGDVIFVPEQPRTVSVKGAVNNALTLNYVAGRKIKYYINRAGGYDQDADAKRVRVVRMDGAVWLAEDIDRIEQGDIIYVPAKVMSAEIRSTTDKILDMVKYVLSTAATVTVFMVLIEKIGN